MAKTVMEADASKPSRKSLKVVAIDCGIKMNIIRSLVKRNLKVIRVPANYTTEQILAYEPDGVVISNGPGDPQKVD